jgi:hypothetical protein
MLIGKDHKPWLKTIAKLEFKWFILGAFLISAVINIGHGFEYHVKKETLVIPNDGDRDRLTYDGSTIYLYNVVFSKDYIDQYPSVNSDLSFFVYSIVYFVFNVLLFFIVNTLIEVKILKCMHKELVEKRERMARMSASKSTALDKNKNTSVEEEDDKKERRVIIMVTVNSLINFFLRIPDFLIFLENSSQTAADYYNSIYPGLASLLLDVSYLAYILTFSFNVLIFYKFNLKFKEAFIVFPKKKSQV